MQFDANLLEVVACPETKAKLILATDLQLSEMNQKITERAIKNVKGEVVSEPLDALLIREDGKIAYPVIEGFARLVRGEGIAL